MKITPTHRERSLRLIRAPEGDGLCKAVDGYLKAVEATTTFNEGFLSTDLSLNGGINLNADEAYATVESDPSSSYANVEVDAGLQPSELRRLAYALLVQADEIEGAS